MIRLIIEGPCAKCPWIQLQLLTEFTDGPEVRCKHQHVCRFAEDRYNDTIIKKKTAQNAK